MDLKVVHHGRIKELVPLVSSIEVTNAQRFKERVREHLEPRVSLVINLEHVDLLDGGGLGALVWLLREVESRAGQVRLCGLKKPVQILLEVVRMHRVFDIYPDTDQAIKGWAHAA